MTNPTEILEELRRRSEHQFHAYKPLPKQKEFHKSTAYVRMIFGGNQSGKSRANAQEIAWWLTGKHPYRKLPDRRRVVWVISTEYQTIKAGVYRHLLQILPRWEIKSYGPKVQGHNLHSFIVMKNGSEVFFLSSKGGEGARTKFQAEAVDYVAIDEEIEEYIWDELQARLLGTGGCFGISATLVESYDWIVELEKRAELNDPDTFLTRLVTPDNPYLDEQQVERLSQSWDEETKRYRFFGKSRRATGLVYPRFNHLIKPFKIPKEWTRYQVLDPGYRVFAGLWGAVSPYQQLILYRELYQQHSDLAEVVGEVKAAEEHEEIDFRIIDDKEGSHLITGEMGVLGLLSTYYDLYYTPAIKSVLAGIEEARNWMLLQDHSDRYTYKADDGTEFTLPARQRLFVFDTLENFKYEISRYRIVPKKDLKNRAEPQDKPIKASDHLMDCFRYLCMQRPAFTPRRKQEQEQETIQMRASRDIISAFELHRKRKQSNEHIGFNW
jgi:hypothetical protein